jgi:hypothetical protein
MIKLPIAIIRADVPGVGKWRRSPYIVIINKTTDMDHSMAGKSVTRHDLS